MTDETGSTHAGDTTPDRSFRVKLYKLDSEGTWEDQGTGYCIYKTGDEDEPDEIFVRSERDETTLLKSKILDLKEYHRQQETLIVWTEGAHVDLALSFQEADGCEHIWQRIQEKHENGQQLPPAISADSDTEDTPPIRESHEPDVLPPPELSNLSQIADILSNAKTIQEKDRLASFIVPESYVDKLIPLFKTCEDLESIDDLHKLYTIMKAIIMLNDNTIVEHIIHDDIYMDVMGMLEYNPDTPNTRTKHRAFLEKCAEIKPVVPIKDEVIISKLHQNLRLKYIKECVFANEVDDSLNSIVHSLTFFNHIDIVSSIQHDSELLSSVFDIFRDEENSTTERKTEGAKFILQFCSMAKCLQAAHRAGLYRELAPQGLFNVLAFALGAEEAHLRGSGVNVLMGMVELDVSFIRTQLTARIKKDGAEKSLMAIILDQFTKQHDPLLKTQYVEIVRLLLDLGGGPVLGNPMTTDTIRKTDPEAEEFLTLFYDNYGDDFLRPLAALDKKPMKLDGPIEILTLSQEQADLCVHICDLLCFAIRQHSFRSKYLVHSTDCLSKILQLYRCNRGYVKLAALRFFRACVGVMDGFYNQNLIKQNVFEPTIRVLLDTDGRNNLLNSACIEILEFIRKENIKPLVSHLVTQYGKVLDTVNYTGVCKALRLRYDQNIEMQETKTESDNASVNSQRGPGLGGWSSSTVDDDEEEYFNNSGDEEEETPSSPGATKPEEQQQQQQPTSTSSTSSTPKPLVDYDDDEEDEDDVPDNSTTQAEDKASNQDESTVPDESSKKVPTEEDATNEPPKENAVPSSDTPIPDRTPSPTPPSPSASLSSDTNDDNLPTLRRRRKHDDDGDEDDDVLAAKASKARKTRSPINKQQRKIIINPQTRKLRSNTTNQSE
ncbi:hypothetical protein O0I10_001850 [Lichtheimia ornata]|uniref:Serine/threonine-protein phosphatase 4 regulatory subunit 3-like central domain-containing protein n=1 Tax=Lichtheimia ornata TaxID=688661 RepID=A0AAD7VAQ3_9FUNG|nr:uncharacterized protein O0I10_001850 [Lichtheimia ornata]KAJ8662157.1 hypothetical protein O0I10_001850 [Lichtheimia ornata]